MSNGGLTKGVFQAQSGPANPAGTHLFLGLDIGSVNVRVAVVDAGASLLYLDRERILSGPVPAVSTILDRVAERFPLEAVAGAAVTGSGRQLYAGQPGWELFSSPYAAITGLLWDQPEAGTIVEVGGQSALVIGLTGGLEKPWRVARSPLCAAGTGRFLEQQASRLGIGIEEFGGRALQWEQAPPRIAARCSVFAKSDLIHLQQKGWSIPAMLAGLSDSVARMIVAQWRDRFAPPVYCTGGVAANRGVVRALSSALGGEAVIVPAHHDGRGAIGAALLAREAGERPAALYPPSEGEDGLFFLQRRLDTVMSTNGWRPAELGNQLLDVYLGVDVGSTSTKAAVVDARGEVLAKSYLMTAGQPLEAIKQVMANLVPQVEGRVRVRATGVTGSGRYLVGNFIGADLIKNEITAQTRAALQLDPEVDTVFELGGQDSKYVYLQNGTVLDYQMNKACAAGTGSFIDELAEQLGISTRTGQFARLAFDAPNQLDLGEKCTAFMSQAVTSAQHAGVPMETIVASLSASLAKNYRSKVVSGRKVGDHIFLTGAVFYNDAVVSAFRAEFPGKTLVVPEHKEVTGAIGAALLAAEAVGDAGSTFKGFSAVAGETYSLTNFNCQRCDHTCAISMMTTDSGQKLYYGSRCDLFDSMAQPGGGVRNHQDTKAPGITVEPRRHEDTRGDSDSPLPLGEGRGEGSLGNVVAAHRGGHPGGPAETPAPTKSDVGADPRVRTPGDVDPRLRGDDGEGGGDDGEGGGDDGEGGGDDGAGSVMPDLIRHPRTGCLDSGFRRNDGLPSLDSGFRRNDGPGVPGGPAGTPAPARDGVAGQSAPPYETARGEGTQSSVLSTQSSAQYSRGGHQAATPFTSREELLFAGYDPTTGTGPVVGVPRALMTFDLAPLLTGFLNALGVRVRYSTPTNKRLIEKSLEHAYTDSCFPLKLLHGHAAELIEEGVDFVLIPNAIRMGRKEGDEDQRYSCPLVQAAPYIVRSVFRLGDCVLDPIIDLSKGDDVLVESMAALAERLGFTRRRGTEAARSAIATQREFEARLAEVGRRALSDLERDPEAIGVVLLSRAYNAQDAGANLGIAQELNKLGVVPIPLDFLPLDQVDVREISDRPYWNYERKLLAAAKLIAQHRQLFGLFLSNFGCGPNSIIQNIVEDIMGGKPLGQIEVDEHAAEAGYITRLEALVDTIKGYRKADLKLAGQPERYVRRVPSSVRSGENVLIARMADHAEVVAAAMRRFGVNAQVLPESDERSMALSRDVTNGKECLPFRDTLGVFLRMSEDGLLPGRGRALMAGSFGPCRLGKYAQEQQKILDDRGIDLEVMTTVSNNAYSDLGLGSGFELLAWRGVVAADHLQRLLWTTRPYERVRGETDRVYQAYLAKLIAAVGGSQPIDRLMRDAAVEFLSLRDPSAPRRPRVGINGEIYLRANRFCNEDLVRVCEAHGLEAEVAPMSEWLKYVTHRNLEDAWSNRELGRLVRGALRKLVLERTESRVSSWFAAAIHEREPSTDELLAASSRYLPARNGSEAVLSLGSGVRQMADPHFAGVISVMPHGCMPGGIVAAFAEEISRENGHKPWISLTYDGFTDKVNPERIADLAEQLRHGARA